MNAFVTDLFSLDGRVALVTGASSGIGRHLSGVLARAGAQVVVVARRAEALDAVVGEIQAQGGMAQALPWDVGDLEGLPALANASSDIFGAPTILITAAGMNPRRPADEISVADWQATLELNLSAPFFLAQALVPGMRAARVGNIINIASLQTSRAFTNGIAYGAAKGGIGQLTRAMAEAWSGGESGIVANAIAPGFFPTELTAPVFGHDATAGHHAAMTCIGRNGQMTDLDGAVLFLASRASSYVTGQILPVDGGYTAK
ncbi:MAG: SDR family NAD(P)-dependent oxidoreductase [Hyphomicrobiaceae bacterium]